MFLLLLVFPLLTLIISFQYFLYPFIVSKNTFPYIITANSYVAQVSQLILNLLEASCPLDESIDYRTMETLRFRHPESNRDTEADILRSDRGTTIMGEEIHGEARWWIEYSVLIIPVDDVKCRCHNHHFFLFVFHHMDCELWWHERDNWYQQNREIIPEWQRVEKSARVNNKMV